MPEALHGALLMGSVAPVSGETLRWPAARRLVACNLIMEYTLSCAAVARGFSSYLATLAGLKPTFFVLEVAVLTQYAVDIPKMTQWCSGGSSICLMPFTQVAVLLTCALAIDISIRSERERRIHPPHIRLLLAMQTGVLPEAGLPRSGAGRSADSHPVLRHQGEHLAPLIRYTLPKTLASLAGLHLREPVALSDCSAASHMLMCSTRTLMQESARFNTIITMINLAVVVFVVCAGMPYAAGSNFDPFAPFGVHGIFSAASVVFFSFIGFDVIATTAEEVCGALSLAAAAAALSAAQVTVHIFRPQL